MSLYCTATLPNALNTMSGGERQRLVESVIPWCKKLARDTARSVSLDGKAIDVEDLEAEAYVAACEAAKRFNPSRGTKFITLATGYIRKHMLAVIDSRRMVLARGVEVPELIADGDGSDDCEPMPYEPNEDESRVLKTLGEPARSIVRMVVFDDLTPAQVAAQLGMDVKDVKLTIRNSADVMQSFLDKEKDREENGIFGKASAS